MEKVIKINTENFQQSVQKISAIAERDGNAIVAKSNRYIVNVKSILGLFSLDLSKIIRIEYAGSNTDAEQFFKSIKPFCTIVDKKE